MSCANYNIDDHFMQRKFTLVKIKRRIFPAFLVMGLLLMVIIIIVQEFRVDVQLFHAHLKA